MSKIIEYLLKLKWMQGHRRQVGFAAMVIGALIPAIGPLTALIPALGAIAPYLAQAGTVVALIGAAYKDDPKVAAGG